MVVAPHGDVAKTCPVVKLATYKLIKSVDAVVGVELIMSVDAVVGVELLATTPAGKHMATVLPNFVLARHLQRLKGFVTENTGVNPLSL